MTTVEVKVCRAQVEEMIRIANDAIHRIDALDEEIAVKCKQHIISEVEYSALHLNNINQVRRLKTNYEELMKILRKMKINNVTKTAIGLVK